MLVLLPHHHTHRTPGEAQEASETLAAAMHRTSWHHAVDLFARTPSTRPAPRNNSARAAYGAAG
ncbi:hypothetical protein [Streptomyces wedmorensis]